MFLSQPSYKTNASPNMKARVFKQREWRNPDKMGNAIAPNNQIISLMIQPPTPCSSNLPNELEGRNAYSGNKAVYGGRNQFSPINQGIEKNSMDSFDFSSVPYSWTGVALGSPPPMRKASQISNMVPQTNKPKTLDIAAGLGPSITITPMSELESDADSSPNLKDTRSMSCFAGNVSPINKGTNQTAGMQYLSPFTITVPIPTTCSGNSRTTSDSNLSSSGYSSMASPGPSRSGSFNPICASESEDASSGTPTKLNCGGPTCFHHQFQHHGHFRSLARSSAHLTCTIHVSETGKVLSIC